MMGWITTGALIAFLVGLSIWCVLLLCVLSLFKFARSTKADDMELDDMEQQKAVSRPADLRPHVKAGPACGRKP